MSETFHWQFLDGLPGEGPVPFHFYVDRPCPWREGTVLGFSLPDGARWIGNFASRRSTPLEVLFWANAGKLLVLLTEDLYVIDANSPASYSVQRGVTNFRLADGEVVLYVADSARVRAWDVTPALLWETGPPGGFDIRLEALHSGTLDISVETELGEPRKALKIRAADGVML